MPANDSVTIDDVSGGGGLTAGVVEETRRGWSGDPANRYFGHFLGLFVS